MRMTLRNLICVLIRDNAVPILFDLNYAQTDGYGGTVRVLDYGILKIGRKTPLWEGLEPTIATIRTLLLLTELPLVKLSFPFLFLYKLQIKNTIIIYLSIYIIYIKEMCVIYTIYNTRTALPIWLKIGEEVA